MLKNAIIQTTRSYIRSSKVVHLATIYKHQETNKVFRNQNMPGIPELVAYDKSELSKAEIKHVLREMRRQIANKTITMKRGYMDIYIPTECKRYDGNFGENSETKSRKDNSRTLKCNGHSEKMSDQDNDTSTEPETSSIPSRTSCSCTGINSSICKNVRVGGDKFTQSDSAVTMVTEKDEVCRDWKSEKRKADDEPVGDGKVKKQRIEKYEEKTGGKKGAVQLTTFSTKTGWMCKVCNFLLKKIRRSGGQNDEKFDGKCEHSKTLINVTLSTEDRNAVESCGQLTEDTPDWLPHSTQYVAMDCEFVGVGPKGSKSYLGRCVMVRCDVSVGLDRSMSLSTQLINKPGPGRCSIVNFDGEVIYDVYCKPDVKVTDYRTRFSGIKPYMLHKWGKPFSQVQREINDIIKDKIVIGHAVHNDFRVLGIKHPKSHIRDTSKYKTLTDMSGTSSGLKILSKALLGRSIQNRSHCSTEDAKATLDLYKLVREEWESGLQGRHIPTDKEKQKSFLDDEFWPDIDESDDLHK